MHLEEVVLDGFKSYAVRTTVSGFDPEFNAITGLNGSGKSNILDAICFVLGISNLSQVRASNLQELVYKQGQAGVQKATVTLVFNNEDDATSPLGYEQYGKITVTRQVIIGGRNKYLINGHTAQLNQVQNLFHSVQLNVNNPHFLIMQGRITKVLNMKPPEILSMLEEAAGTRLFEVKKEAALKTIDKKARKVDEISTVLDEEISPKLEKLRGERAGYMKWASNNTEMERLSRFCIANDFYKADVTMTKAVEQVQEVQNDLASLTADSEEAEAKVSDGNNQIEELRKDKELEMGADFKKAEAKVTEMSKTMVKQASVWQNKKETLDSDKEGCQTIRSGIEDAGKQTKNVSQKLATAEQTCAHLEAESKALTDRAEDMQRQLLAGELSTDAGEGADGSLADQLEQAKTKVTSSGTAAKQLEMKVKHMRAELEAKSKEQGKGEKEYAGLATAHQKLDRELKAITIKLHEVDYDESKERDLLGKKTAAEQTIETLQEKVDDLSSKLSRISFEYADPVKGFDKSKVKGLVAELLELKDPNTATALEVVAGGGLYSVVVDSDQTGKLLLKNGKLKKRVTIIPLNKIDTRGTISEKKMQTAAKLVGSSNISTALSLVGYESEIEAAMKYVFGRSFVCKNAKVAEAVTYHKDIKTKCVTLDGDIFQPSGTLSGGSRPQSASVLERLQALHDAQKQLDQNKRTLERINAELVEVQRTGAAYRELHSQKEMKSHEADMIRARIETSTHQQQLDEIKGMEAELDVSRENLKASFDDKKAAELKCKELDKAIKNFEKDRANKMKEIEDQVAKAKKDAAAGNKKWKDSATKYEELKLEAAEAENESESLQKQLQDKEAGLLELEQAVTELEEKAAECKQNYEDANTDLDSRRKRISDCEKEIVKLTKARNAAQKKQEKAELEIKKVAHKLERMEKENAGAEKLIGNFLKKYPWIESERHLFGQKKTDYDFDRRNPDGARQKLAELEEEQDTLSKKINKKVMSMFEKAEQEYQDLVQRKSIIENDKSKIEKVIAELDEKKNETLKKTWQKVNKDFGSIFSTLLPGAQAKLEPEEGRSVLDGLVVCVALGKVWKNSLTELSGGQRSLLALSLVLALLLYKPAPMYILDEVDAALDLSHTQNIGTMIKNHFKNSQFIVVSLKEGMFNNANVIFRTKFVDGVSTVSRTVNSV